MFRVLATCLVGSVLFVVGCGSQGLLGTSSLAGVEGNGVEGNGVEGNGVEGNGVEGNGVEGNGSDLATTPLRSIRLNGTVLTAIAADGTSRTGQALVGATLPSGRLRIDDIRRGTGSNDDLRYYAVSYRTTRGRWKPLCGTEADGTQRLAIPLAGTWDARGTHVADPTRFSFACRRAALAKCVELGYRPWESRRGVSLAAHHQACTRMIRADYCGDGRSFTVNGRLVNVYDGLGIQADTNKWTFEAEWDAHGARCIKDTRLQALEELGQGLPACVRRRISASCGNPDNFRSGTLLMDEFQTALVVSAR